VVPAFHRYWYEADDTWLANTYLGYEIFQCPLDLQLYQELIFRLRPDFIVQTGVAQGGSLLYFATLLDLIEAPPTAVVVGVDIVMSEKARSLSNPRIKLFEGDSVDVRLIDEIRAVLPRAAGWCAWTPTTAGDTWRPS